MTKPKSRTISAPFDARHVGGVSIPGATVPIVGIERSSTSLEPDNAPSHTFVAHGNIEVPRRSHTIASTLGRPSLTLKTSISLLRGRSNSNAQAPEPTDGSLKGEMSVHSLRKKTSTSRFWQKAHHESPVAESPKEDKGAMRAFPPHKETPVLRTKPSHPFMPSLPTANPYVYQAPPVPSPPPPPASELRQTPPQRAPTQKKLPVVRSKRADSGTAIDFDDVPAEERPLGFREILAVSSFSERMALYKKTRDYWAHADHGLVEWVDRSRPRPSFRV
ncbi:uncharacterized protein CC84DRAFT_1200641 [Paraphaeosphaeria sporulosa]|uniref:Uncharacterized protein n=1 Tax=Paraphaeosphaeria sporulosa TaxID=1460663 RepID=A0A177CUZ6_9PLEO|nr:uncharacterized protein CC84DRAFT_1200641 [Paraphaeosphaeria sporulosa]OAG11343.1 hypothetical protein CC84DRAFT_1200641 [Paraphaeosphaeria sporulosa]